MDQSMKFQEIRYTEQEKQTFKEEFAKRQKRQWGVAAVVLLFAAPFLYMKITKKTLELSIPMDLLGPVFAGVAKDEGN